MEAVAGDGLARAALDGCPLGFAAVDHEGRLVALNHTAERMLGWRAQDVLGGPDPSLLSDLQERTQASVARLREDSDSGPSIVRRLTSRGDAVDVVMTGYVNIPTEDGSPTAGAFFRLADGDEIRAHRRNELSRRLVEATRVDEVLRAAQETITEVLGASRAVVLAPCAHGHLHGEHLLGGFREEAERIELTLEPDAAWTRALETDAAIGRLTVDDGERATLFVHMGPTKERSLLGLLYDGPAPVDLALHELAASLADEIWLALKRAELVSELEGKVEILEATAAVASSVDLDLEDTMQAVCHHAAEALSCERAGVYLRRPDGTLVVGALYASDLDVSEPAGYRLADEVLQRGDAVLVQDVEECAFVDGPWHREQGAVSVLGLPLRIGERDLGVLAVSHTQANPRGFTNLCQQVGAAVAQQAAIAIEHARLYRDEQAAVQQLRDLDQLKADYVAGLTHDLRSPLTGLLGFTSTLRRLGDAVDETRRVQYLEAMERQAGRLVAMVEDMLLATQLEQGGLRPSRNDRVDLAVTVADALDGFEPARRRRVRFTGVPLEPPVVCGDASQLLRVVRNLIDNALKYSPDDQPVDVAVSTGDGRVSVTVRDRGEGLTPEVQETVFERFRTADGVQRSGSSGLGLYICRGIARGHGGDVVYEDAPDGGALFQLQVPVGEGC